jgi:hypothetical protein
MLAVSGGRYDFLSTPFGNRGFFYKEWSEGGEDWRKVEITARDCTRIYSEWRLMLSLRPFEWIRWKSHLEAIPFASLAPYLHRTVSAYA